LEKKSFQDERVTWAAKQLAKKLTNAWNTVEERRFSAA
jgi:hypothetical protein